jgi:hypothetical protein
VDFNPPYGFVQDGNKSADIAWQSEDNVLCASWANISDRESGIETFEVAYGVCKTSFERTAIFTNVGLQTSYCFIRAKLQLLMQYCVAVRSLNKVADSSLTISDGVVISKPPATENAIVYDGTNSEDLDYTHETSYTATWTGFEEQGAPIRHFYARIFREDNKQLVHELCNETALSSCSANLSTSILAPGVKVFTQVCSVNIVNQVACARSDGFIPDYDPPQPGKVVNGRLLWRHAAAQPERQSVAATWEGFIDVHTPIAACTWSIGDRNDKESILEATNVGRSTWAEASLLSLEHGLVFYITVACTNMAGLTSQSVSEPVLVHTMAPSFSHVELYHTTTMIRGNMVYASRSSHVQLAWGIHKESSKGLSVTSMVAIGTTMGGQDVQAFGEECTSPFTIPDLPTNIYYVSILLKDSLDRTAYHANSTLVIDSTPPLSDGVTIWGFAPKAMPCVQQDRVLNIFWSSFIDVDSSILHHEVGVGQGADADSVLTFESVGTSTQHTLNVSGLNAGHYVLSVRAQNMAGLYAVVSRLFVIDASKPQLLGKIQVQTGQESGHELACHAQGTELHFMWDSFDDSDCSVVGYEYAIWSSPDEWAVNASDCIMFHNLGLSRNVSVTPSSFTLGGTYQLLVRATNEAGLQNVASSRQVLMSSANAMISVHHNSTAVSDMSQLAGHVIVYNTTGYVRSLTCSAGIQRYGKHITNERPVAVTSGVMGQDGTYTINMPCGAQQPQALADAFLNGHDVYLTARLVFCTGKVSLLSSQAARVDLTRPSPGIVQVLDAQQPAGFTVLEAHVPCGRANHTLRVTWDRFVDNDSGILSYDVGVGKSEGSDSFVKFKSVGTAQSYNIDTTGFEAGLHAVSVRAWNKAGLSTIVSAEFRIDATAPATNGIIRVRHPVWGTLPADAACHASGSALGYLWDDFSDDECPIVAHEYMVSNATSATWPTADEGIFTSLGLDQHVLVPTPPNAIGKRYSLVLRATNAAGLQTFVQSKPVLVASPDPQFEVIHKRQWVSNVLELSGSLVVRNTTGFFTSLECSAGTQQFSQQFTQSRRTPVPDDFRLLSSEHVLPISCSSKMGALSNAWDGAKVYLTATAAFCTGQVKSEASAEAYIDTSKPHGGSIHFLDDSGKHVHTHWDTTDLRLEWGLLVDEHSGISLCELGVLARNSSHDNVVRPFTKLDANQNATNITLDTGLEKVAAISATLRCQNKAGLWGHVTSDLTIDTTPPQATQIVHVTLDGHRGATCQHALDALRASWESFTDEESGLDHYEYSVVLLDGTEVQEWRSVGSFTSATARGLSLNASTVYVVQVRGWNKAGLSSVASSAGIMARPAQPAIVSVANDMGEQLPLATPEERKVANLHVTVSGYATRVECSISSSSHTSQVSSVHTGSLGALTQAWNVTCNLSNYTLYSGHTYFISVSAYACSELESPSFFSHKVLYDASAPLNGHVRAEKIGNYSLKPPFGVQQNLISRGYVSRSDSLNVSWGGFVDVEGPVVSYDVTLRVCTDASASGCVFKSRLATLDGSGNNSLQINAADLRMEHNVRHALQVEAANSAGLSRTRHLVIVMDDTPPQPGRVFNTEVGRNLTKSACLGRTDALSAAWEGFADEESPLVGYEWSAGRSPSDADLVPWTPVDTHATRASAVLAEGIKLVVRDKVYVAVRVGAPPPCVSMSILHAAHLCMFRARPAFVSLDKVRLSCENVRDMYASLRP